MPTIKNNYHEQNDERDQGGQQSQYDHIVSHNKMDLKKLPLPMIKLEDVMPKNENDMKCGPHLSFENGSCIPLNILIKMGDAYNEYYDNNNNNNNENIESKIKLDDRLETLYPDEYKRHLLFEFGKRFKGNQHDWIKHKFSSFMEEEDRDHLENHTFRPSGPQGKFDWLSTIDINYALAQYENKYSDFKFLGAVPIDFNDLDYLPFKTLNFDELVNEGKTRIGVVFNLDEHYKGGSHWVSLFFDLAKGQIYFSDSYGTKPEKRIVDFISKIEKYLTSNSTKPISKSDVRFNRIQHQKGNSECGVYSINFILRLLKGKTFDHITRKRVTDEKVNKCRMVYFNNSNSKKK